MSYPTIEKRHMVGYSSCYDPAYGFEYAFDTILKNVEEENKSSELERAFYSGDSWFKFVFGSSSIPAPHTPRERFPWNYIVWAPFRFSESYGPFS